jgi:hypothetical protein
MLLCSVVLSGDVNAVMQLQHSRSGAVTSKLETGRFGGARSLKLSSNGQLAAGSVASADLEPERLDNQMLLDYGVLDEDSPQVR